MFRWWTYDSCWGWRVIVITMDAHGSGFNFIAASHHPPGSPHESTYQHIPPWYGRWSSHDIPFGIFFSLLRSYSTKYITSFYFLSLSLYLVLIARSIPKLLCFEFMYLFNNGNGVLYVCVRVARSIPKLLCFGLNYLSNGNGGLYLFMFKDILG